MSLKTNVFAQFGNPNGPLGSLVGHVMAAKGDSRTRGRWTVDLLELDPTDRVLELGYGPGVVTGWLCDEVPEGQVVGVDRSATIRDQAARRNRARVASGRLDLRVGDAEHLPDGSRPVRRGLRDERVAVLAGPRSHPGRDRGDAPTRRAHRHHLPPAHRRCPAGDDAEAEITGQLEAPASSTSAPSGWPSAPRKPCAVSARTVE